MPRGSDPRLRVRMAEIGLVFLLWAKGSVLEFAEAANRRKIGHGGRSSTRWEL